MRVTRKQSVWAILAVAMMVLATLAALAGFQQLPAPKFHLEEATIADIQQAIKTRQITTVQLVRLYLDRVKAYNGTCVNQPDGPLGFITPIPHARQINALMTLNEAATHHRTPPPEFGPLPGEP